VVLFQAVVVSSQLAGHLWPHPPSLLSDTYQELSPRGETYGM